MYVQITFWRDIEPRTYGYLLYIDFILTMWVRVLLLVSIYEVLPN